jgi:class 3 adenylate cyclase
VLALICSLIPAAADSCVLLQAWSQLGNDPTQQLGFCVWRGLRVRMGIHSGLANSMHVTYNKASHRTQYSGDFASTAKGVGDAGHGGQIVLSGDAFSQLTAQDHSKGLCVLLMGEHVLKEGEAAQPLYQAVVPGLEPRLERFPPLRTRELVQDGVQQAPVGTVTVVFMNGIGVSTLLGWNAQVAQQSVQLYHRVVSALLPKYLGYVVEMADGLCLAAFQRPEQAIAWALASQAALIDAAWPEALLEHELCEVITTTVAVSSKQASEGLTIMVLLYHPPTTVTKY